MSPPAAGATAVLAFDTATPATAVAVLDGEWAVERRHDPQAGERPGHAARLLALVEEALAAAGRGWEQVARLGVGVGPGGFTGLRIGMATARGLAQGLGLPLVGVGTLEALARGATTGPEAAGRVVVAVLHGGRGEVFAAGWDPAGRPVMDAAAMAPGVLAGRLAGLGAVPLAVGDGAVEFRDRLEAAGAVIPADDSPLHRVGAVHVARLAREAPGPAGGAVLPRYHRLPDAEIALRRRAP